MIKTLVIAAALSFGLAGYAVAQDTTTGAPAGTAPMTAEPRCTIIIIIITTTIIITITTITCMKWLPAPAPAAPAQ